MMAYPAHTPSQLGPLLRGFRKQRGLTQAALAARVGLAQKAVSLAETHPERMGVERLFRILAGLEVELVLRERDSTVRKTGGW
jgi:HTH-type transcriptional regulator / antitoxin HipB